MPSGHPAQRRPCPAATSSAFARIVRASRGTRPLPLHPLPSPPFRTASSTDHKIRPRQLTRTEVPGRGPGRGPRRDRSRTGLSQPPTIVKHQRLLLTRKPDETAPGRESNGFPRPGPGISYRAGSRAGRFSLAVSVFNSVATDPHASLDAARKTVCRNATPRGSYTAGKRHKGSSAGSSCPAG